MGDTQSLSLAVRYRPRSFSTVIGQRHVTEVLRRAVLNDRVPQQLLFSGGSGLGKTTVARIVAAAMLCETPMEQRDRGDVCSVCESCMAALTPGRSHPDLIEFDAASHGGKDEIREISSRAQIVPVRSRSKVYIIDEAHGLSHPGGQAFLKLLEEPPPHVVFMLCTTDPQKMLKTNRGRCVEFELLPPTHDEQLANLQRICDAEGWKPERWVFDMILDVSDPDLGVRGTVTTLAKLEPGLAENWVPNENEISALLGTPPPLVTARLAEAIESLDPSSALAELGRARSVVSDTAIQHALLRWARARVRDSLGDAATLKLALWGLETVLASPGEGARLEVLVARLATPESTRIGAEALTDVAGMLLKELRETVNAAKAVRPVAEPATNEPVKVAGSVPTPAAAQLLAAAAPAPAELPALLARCAITVSPEHVDLVAPDELVAVITPHVPLLRTAAGRLGLPLRLRKASTAAKERKP